MKAMGAAAFTSAIPRFTRGQPRNLVKVFLCGDVMTGRGIDQILPRPSDPRIYERYAKSALDYVALAERKNGTIKRPAGYDYTWGAALAELGRRRPDARIVNLETSITAHGEPSPKGIHYRMSPANTPCLTAAHIDCCVLANNHVLDWGRAGCVDTLDTLSGAGIETAGAGRDAAEASSPAILPIASGRVVVFGFGSTSSGIPPGWAATTTKAGVNLLPDLSDETADRIGGQVRGVRRENDIVIASIHWGSNWGYDIPSEHCRFAHRLIDRAGVDVIHGHSSHHPRGIEIHSGKPILYGCGDFINDYEGIRGHERYRGDLVLMYFLTIDVATRRLVRLDMVPLQLERFRLRRPSRKDMDWMRATLTRASRKLGTTLTQEKDGTLEVELAKAP